MSMSPFRAAFGVMFALAVLSLAPPSSAQQKTPPAPQQAPALSQSQPPGQAPAPPVAAQPAPAPAASDSPATSADGGSRPLKSTSVALRELSPWSRFVS